jgi:hypothetical protein
MVRPATFAGIFFGYPRVRARGSEIKMANTAIGYPLRPFFFCLEDMLDMASMWASADGPSIYFKMNFIYLTNSSNVVYGFSV